MAERKGITLSSQTPKMIPRKRFLPLMFEDRALAPRLRLLRLAARVLIPSYRLRWPQLDWWKNDEFTRYLERFGELRNLNTDRKWMIHQLLRLVAHVPGDTAECGVFEAATSYLICCANRQSRAGAKTHHLFDSFEGLSEPGCADGKHWAKGDMKCDIDSVRKALSGFAEIAFHPGWIPERFRDVAHQRFSFVHIDVDLGDPTCESITFFYPRMQPGGIIVCDDYGMSTCPGATQAIDHFLSDKVEKMLTLPDGGGFLIMNARTMDPARLDQKEGLKG
jgi:O-methyltransferase